MDPFAADTFLCLDLPMPIADQVLTIRRAFGDAFRAALPAEITVVGFSGLGVVAPGQDPRAVFSILERVAATMPPISAMFGSVIRFPRTDIFALTLVDESPFRALHPHLAASGIQFQSSPYPFTPHCTLCSRSPITEREGSALHIERYSGLSCIRAPRNPPPRTRCPLLDTTLNENICSNRDGMAIRVMKEEP